MTHRASQDPFTQGLFSFYGRRGRKPFILALLLFSFIPQFFGGLAFYHALGSDNTALALVMSPILLATIYLSATLGAQRLRDVGISPWFIIGVFVLQAVMSYMSVAIWGVLMAFPDQETAAAQKAARDARKAANAK